MSTGQDARRHRASGTRQRSPDEARVCRLPAGLLNLRDRPSPGRVWGSQTLRPPAWAPHGTLRGAVWRFSKRVSVWTPTFRCWLGHGERPFRPEPHRWLFAAVSSLAAPAGRSPHVRERHTVCGSPALGPGQRADAHGHRAGTQGSRARRRWPHEQGHLIGKIGRCHPKLSLGGNDKCKSRINSFQTSKLNAYVQGKKEKENENFKENFYKWKMCDQINCLI